MLKYLSSLIGVLSTALILTNASSCNDDGCLDCDQYDTYEYAQEVVDDVNRVYKHIFDTQSNGGYSNAAIQYFAYTTSTGCGSNKSGPLYCPSDNTVYLDLAFLDGFEQKVNASGRLSTAYIIAHEIAHHIQDNLGIVQSVFLEQDHLSITQYNAMKKNLELQADFLAGVYIHHSYLLGGMVDNLDDLESAKLAVKMTGEDYLFPRMPSSQHTHGSMQERVAWFLKGVETGDLDQGNTFLEVY